MNRKTRWAAALMALAVLAVALGAAGCGNVLDKLKARDNLNKGVNSYKNAKFDEAIKYFEEAKRLDPTLLNARLYLATTHAGQYIPNAPSEENQKRGEMAVAEYKAILEIDPNNLPAIDGLASILFKMAGTPYDPEKFAEARSYHQRHIEISPNDPEPYYTIGVINWTLAWRANREMRSEYNNRSPRRPVKDDEPLPPALREEFAAKHGPTIEEAIRNLEKAMQLRQDYDEAMVYLNLVYRQKADMAASADEREEYLTRADDLSDRAMAIRRRREAEAAAKSH